MVTKQTWLSLHMRFNCCVLLEYFPSNMTGLFWDLAFFFRIIFLQTLKKQTGPLIYFTLKGLRGTIHLVLHGNDHIVVSFIGKKVTLLHPATLVRFGNNTALLRQIKTQFKYRSLLMCLERKPYKQQSGGSFQVCMCTCATSPDFQYLLFFRSNTSSFQKIIFRSFLFHFHCHYSSN